MKLTNQSLARICRGLSLLLHSGIPLSDGVYLLAEEGEQPELMKQLGASLDLGASLSQAMEDSGAFPSHVLGMTAIGEETGRTEEVLSSLADFFEQRQRTARLIKNALAYPAMIFLLMLLVVGVLLTKVLPVFDQVYASLGSGLTGLAGGLLRLGQGLEQALPFLAALLGVLTAAAVAVLLKAGLREKAVQHLRIRFGDRGILRKFNNARFAQAMAMSMSSGLPMEQAMEMAQSLLEDMPPAARRCAQCAQLMENGETLAQAMANADLLPPSESRILTLSLRSGASDQVMADVARRLMEDAEGSLEAAVARIEPILVLTASALVGAIILAVMLPLSGLLAAMG